MASTSLTQFSKNLANHPRRVVLVVMTIIFLWFGWSAYSILTDQMLNENDVISRQVRVQQQSLDSFTKNLGQYRQPEPPENGLPGQLFVPTPSQR